MGPLLDSSGEARRVLAPRPGGWRLQWGRCSTAAERPRAKSRRFSEASMGPLLDSSGEAIMMAGVRRGAARASMGPLLDSSGERRPRSRERGLTPLQWGRCSTAAESRDGLVALPARSPRASMGPLLDSSGEHRCANDPVGQVLVGCFNGAAARQQRRAGTRSRPCTACALETASMGPLLDSRDSRRVAAVDGPGASMGPLLDSSGERGSTPNERWPSLVGASMGPLLDSSGEGNPVRQAPRGADVLQWGRCSTAAESAR